MSLADRQDNGEEAKRVPTTKVKAPPGAPPPKLSAVPGESPNARRLWQFNVSHQHLPGTISVTVFADAANARGLAYLIAEDFCSQVIGQIKAE